MQVGRWSSKLSVRLRGAVVKVLGLKEGDEIGVGIAGTRAARSEAMQRLQALQKPLPSGFRFSRDEAHER